MANLCYREDYKNKFDGKTYLNTYFKLPEGSPLDEGSYIARLFAFLQKELNKLDNQNGKRLLDFGCGPNIINLLFASRVFSDVTLADYSENNRRYLSKWVNKEDGAYDWSPYERYVSSLEGTGSTEYVASRARKAVREIIPADIMNENPFHPNTREPFDCIITTFCLEASANDLENYRKSVKRLASLIKPNGLCLVTGVLEETFYDVGEFKYFALKMYESDVVLAFKDAGFIDIEIDSVYDIVKNDPTMRLENNLVDCGGFFLMSARKSL